MKYNKFKNIKDEELVALYVTTQKNIYFEEIYNRYANKVLGRCYSFVNNREKAEDWTHDIFLKLILKIGSFKQTSRFSTWLYSITYNYCMDQLRNSKKEVSMDIFEGFDLSDGEEEVENMESLLEDLEVSLEKMSIDEQALLQMKYQDGFSIKEISKATNASESAIKMRLLRAKEKLRKIYFDKITLVLALLIKFLSFFE